MKLEATTVNHIINNNLVHLIKPEVLDVMMDTLLLGKDFPTSENIHDVPAEFFANVDLRYLDAFLWLPLSAQDDIEAWIDSGRPYAYGTTFYRGVMPITNDRIATRTQ